MESIQILNSSISFSSPKSARTLAVQSQSMRLMMGCHDNLDKIGPENEERGRNLGGESNGNGGVFERPTRTRSEVLDRVGEPAQEKIQRRSQGANLDGGKVACCCRGGRGEPEHTRQHLEPGPVKLNKRPLHTIKTLIPQKVQTQTLLQAAAAQTDQQEQRRYKHSTRRVRIPII